MKSPLASGPWLELDEVASTQDVAAKALKAGGDVPGVVLAHHQTQGRGRFQRPWVSGPGQSLTMSLIFREYADHPRPWLIAMAVATAAAGVLHCRLQWPNDLVLEGKKLGGLLSEMLPDQAGRLVPVVGVGVNVGDVEFPEDVATIATSLAQHGRALEPRSIARAILERLDSLPEPNIWQDLAPIWGLFDSTAGKRYRLPDGSEALALGVGPQGELLCAVDGESTTVMAAEAHFGPSAI